jgi:glutamate carboxypeptidase
MIEHVNLIHFFEKEMLELLKTLASIASPTKDLHGIAQMCHVLKKATASLDGDLELIPLAPTPLINNQGDLTPTHLGTIFKLSKYPKAPVQILLSGHMDTVNSLKGREPFVKEETGKLYGPGVADMKGGLVVMLYALKAFEKSAFKGKIGWEVFITPDEEIGSIGSYNYLVNSAKNKDAALIFEPSLPDGSFVRERKGSLNFTVVARGKSAHAGRNYFSGVNAISGLNRFLLDIGSLTDQERGITVNPGVIRGGVAANVVPDFALCRCNIRMKNQEDFAFIQEVLHMVKNLVEEGQEGPAIEIYTESVRPPKLFDGKTENLFANFALCAQALNIPFHLKPSGGVCDGNILASQGLPTIDTLGVVGDHIHTEEEYMLINSLVERCKLTTLFLLNLAKEMP